MGNAIYVGQDGKIISLLSIGLFCLKGPDKRKLIGHLKENLGSQISLKRQTSFESIGLS